MTTNEPGEPIVPYAVISHSLLFEVRAAKNSDIPSLLYIREQNECMALSRK